MWLSLLYLNVSLESQTKGFLLTLKTSNGKLFVLKYAEKKLKSSNIIARMVSITRRITGVNTIITSTIWLQSINFN